MSIRTNVANLDLDAIGCTWIVVIGRTR
jgi:hypothetical protein